MLDTPSAREPASAARRVAIHEGQKGSDDMRSTEEDFGTRAEPDDVVRAIVTRLSRPHPSGGVVIEHAAILAEGAGATAVVEWIIAHAGQPEAVESRGSTRGLHGTRMSGGGGAARHRARRYVLPAGALGS